MRYHSTATLTLLMWLAACGSPPAAQQATDAPATEPSAGGAPVATEGTTSEAEPKTSDQGGAPSEDDSAQPSPDDSPATDTASETPAEDSASKADSASAQQGPAETRTTEVIQRVVLNNRQSARNCYDLERSKVPELAGTLTIFFVIDPQGNVKHAELNQERSTLGQDALVQCVIRAIQRLKFPPSSRGFESEINYPFDFRP